jgi:O-antigen/teichoic acid export membrane protein
MSSIKSISLHSYSKFKKPIFDVFINIIANLIPVAILHFIIMPLVARKLGVGKNDLFLVYMSIIHVVVSSTGIALSNARLIMDRCYQDKNIIGDFNIILIGYSFINLFVMIIASIIYNEGYIFNIILLGLITIIWALKDYLLVSFKLKLNFTKIMLNNLYLGIGLLIGGAVFYFLVDKWQLIFFIGYLFAFIHVLYNTVLLKEPYTITKLFVPTTRKAVFFSISILIGLIPTSCGSLILYPYGVSFVSVFTAASLMGKILSMLYSPLSSVLISYLVKIKSITLKSYLRIVLFALALGMFGYVVCLVISKPILYLLYPFWADNSLELVPITVAIGMFGLLSSVINPIILNFGHEKWQIIINVIYLICYLSLSVLLLQSHGLYGFCIGNLCAVAIKFLTILLIGTKSLGNSYGVN